MASTNFSGWLRSSPRKKSLAYYRLSGNILAISSNEQNPVSTWMNLRGAEVSCDASKKLIKVFRSGKSYSFYTTADEYNSWSSSFLNAAKLNIREVYKWSKLLGTGGFATVRLAMSTAGASKFEAVKIINKSDVKRREAEFVVRELRTVLTCTPHPHLVHTNAVYEDENYVYIAMEYMASGSLTDYMSKRGTTLGEAELKLVMKALLSGIAELHRRNAVHRDIKPENLLLEDENDLAGAKLADFGFCRFLENDTVLKEVLGTVSFMAPEVIKRKGYGKEVDMWSAGITMYNLLTNSFPFRSTAEVDIIKQLKEIDVLDIALLPNLSPDGHALLTGLLTVDKAKRITIEHALASRWFQRSEFGSLKDNAGANSSLQSFSDGDLDDFYDSSLGFEPSTVAASVFDTSVEEFDATAASNVEDMVQSLASPVARAGKRGSADDADAYKPFRRWTTRLRQYSNLQDVHQKLQTNPEPMSPTQYSDHFGPKSTKAVYSFIPKSFSRRSSLVFSHGAVHYP